MTTGIKCDECDRFLPTEVLEGGALELEHYVQINLMEGFKHTKPPEHYCYSPCWMAKVRVLERAEKGV